MNIRAAVQMVAWVAATAVGAHEAQGAGVGGVVVLIGAAVVVGGWTTFVRRALGSPWTAAWRAGGERAVEEVMVKAAALAVGHAATGTVPPVWMLMLEAATEVGAAVVIWELRRRGSHR
ncbi:hypothetical protein [Kitasatospora griseola]|uniref:hypothetical protein n=1 Tax=Kitasatospora griseola TaxID=2064 RepID=UPI00166FD1F3|nr:hypothetical protein [Kitasatospora griseola]GGR01930.1 hypothetical protein GCM10010195_67100 [Kitasatospora griseola]